MRNSTGASIKYLLLLLLLLLLSRNVIRSSLSFFRSLSRLRLPGISCLYSCQDTVVRLHGKVRSQDKKLTAPVAILLLLLLAVIIA
jgi:hypothetical protein